MASDAILINRKPPQITNYLESDRLGDCVDTDAIHIEYIRHRLIYGRTDGYTLPDTRFVLRLGLISGVRVEGFANPPSGEWIIRTIGRSRLRETDIIPDFRRYNTPMDSFTQFMANIPLMIRGI